MTACSLGMKTIVNNLAVEYEDHGNGPVLLLLHGWQDNLHTFDKLFPILLKSWRVIALDLPGFGKSESPKTAWNLSVYVAFVKEFLKKIDVSPNVIIGHSFGGRIAIKGLSTKILAAHKVVLIASAGIAKTNTARSLLFTYAAKIGKVVTYIPPFFFYRNTLRKRLYDRSGSDYMNAGALKETFLNVVREDLSHDAESITIPVLLLWGSNDTQTPLSDGQKFARMIHGAKLQVFEGAGHFVHREKPKEVAQAIRSFAEQ